MPHLEFERFLSLLSKLLKLSSKETAAIADEICDHLEERYTELLTAGVSAEEAVRQALSEFDDASTLASRLTSLVQQRKRRRIMTATLGTTVTAMALIATAAFWPDQPQPPGGGTSRALAATGEPDSSSTGPIEASAAMPKYVGVSRFLPDAMKTGVTSDVQKMTLGEFARLIQSSTGLTVLVDHDSLQAVGASADNEISVNAQGIPAYLMLSRVLKDVNGVELEWTLDGNVLTIVTADHAARRMDTASFDIAPLLKGGNSAESLVDLVQNLTTCAWQDKEGEGGPRPQVFENVLTVRQTLRDLLSVRALLAALPEDAREVIVAEPLRDRDLMTVLDAPVSLKVSGATLIEVAAELAKQLNVEIDIDHRALQEMGASADSEISMDLMDVPLRLVIERLKPSGIEMGIVAADGRLILTTSELAESQSLPAIFDVSDLARDDAIESLRSLILTSTAGPWEDIDGNGGILIARQPGKLFVRHSLRAVTQVQTLIADHRRMLAHSGPKPAPAPEAIEIRYYRLPERTATDLEKTIPKFVATETWAFPPDIPVSGQRVGVIQKVYVDVVMGSDGPHFENGGGGFFQLGGIGQPGGFGGGGGGMGGGLGGGGMAISAPYTVLVIQQTRAVHEQIRKFINELAHREADRTYGGSQPLNDVFWSSGLQPRLKSADPADSPPGGQLVEPASPLQKR